MKECCDAGGPFNAVLAVHRSLVKKGFQLDETSGMSDVCKFFGVGEGMRAVLLGLCKEKSGEINDIFDNGGEDFNERMLFMVADAFSTMVSTIIY